MNPQRLLELWNSLEDRPLGKKIFSYFLGRSVPYSGTIGAEIQELRPGFSRVKLTERRAVQNHLQSVHAVALVNLAELTTGLAATTSLPPSGRIILKSLHMNYLKKARGVLIATAQTPLVTEEVEKADVTIATEVRNEAGELVATLEAVWQIGCKKQ